MSLCRLRQKVQEKFEQVSGPGLKSYKVEKQKKSRKNHW